MGKSVPQAMKARMKWVFQAKHAASEWHRGALEGCLELHTCLIPSRWDMIAIACGSVLVKEFSEGFKCGLESLRSTAALERDLWYQVFKVNQIQGALKLITCNATKYYIQYGLRSMISTYLVAETTEQANSLPVNFNVPWRRRIVEAKTASLLQRIHKNVRRAR